MHGPIEMMPSVDAAFSISLQFLIEREEALDEMFPTAQLLPGAGALLCCWSGSVSCWVCSQRYVPRSSCPAQVRWLLV